MDKKTKANMRKRPLKCKISRGTIWAMFALAILFFFLCQWQVKVFFSGNHSFEVVVAFVIFSGLSGLFLLFFLGFLVIKLGD